MRQAFSIAIRVAASPKELTSIGSVKAPSVSTSLRLVGNHDHPRSKPPATIFSRSSAPPPPLIRRSLPSTSSAPSTVRSSSGKFVQRLQRHAEFDAKPCRTFRRRNTLDPESHDATFSASRRTNSSAVRTRADPEAHPALRHGSSAAAAALIFISRASMRRALPKSYPTDQSEDARSFFPLRRLHGCHGKQKPK